MTKHQWLVEMRIELPAVTLPKNPVAHGSRVGEFKEGIQYS